MTVYVANSGKDENGRSTYGRAGDQTGAEWWIIPWYYYGQNVVLRYPNADVASLLAELATEAANNDLIGYDQTQRLTFWNELKKVGYRPSKITTPCEGDCSAGVAALVKAVGYLMDIPALRNFNHDSYTGNLKQRLEQAGFVSYTSSEYTRSSNKLQIGDVNLKNYDPGAHTNIVVQGPKPTPSAKLDVDGILGKISVSELQKQLGTYVDGVISGQYKPNEKYLARLVSIEWQATGSPCIKALQCKIGAKADGIAGYETVRCLQKWLNQNTNNNLAIDGYLGNMTACAVQRALNNHKFK